MTDAAIQLLDIPSIVQDFKTGKKNRLNIADPTSGSNTFLIRFDMALEEEFKRQEMEYPKNSIYYYGQELKQFQGALGVLNMMFHGLIDVYNVGTPIEDQIKNSITQYYDGIGKHRLQMDVVLANPPYGVKDYGYDYAISNKDTDHRFKVCQPNKSEGEHAFVLTIYDLLNTGGKAAVVLPLGTLFRDAGSKVREYLIDHLEGIVVLPDKMFLTTQIPVCIWVFNKQKKKEDQDHVFMVNASHDFVKVGKFNQLQPDISRKAYLTREEIENYSGRVSVEKIKKNGFNLSVGRYFSKKQDKQEIDLAKTTLEIEKLKTTIKNDSEWLDGIFDQIGGQ